MHSISLNQNFYIARILPNANKHCQSISAYKSSQHPVFSYGNIVKIVLYRAIYALC